MCYLLDIITYKDITKQEITEYSKEHWISIYNKTPQMTNAEEGKRYYSLAIGGCACGIYQGDVSTYTCHALIGLLDDCIRLGELILFFYWDNGDYYLYENDVHTYIKKAKKVNIQFEDFLDTFMTKEFNGKGIVYFIEPLPNAAKESSIIMKKEF